MSTEIGDVSGSCSAPDLDRRLTEKCGESRRAGKVPSTGHGTRCLEAPRAETGHRQTELRAQGPRPHRAPPAPATDSRSRPRGPPDPRSQRLADADDPETHPRAGSSAAVWPGDTIAAVERARPRLFSLWFAQGRMLAALVRGGSATCPLASCRAHRAAGRAPQAATVPLPRWPLTVPLATPTAASSHHRQGCAGDSGPNLTQGGGLPVKSPFLAVRGLRLPPAPQTRRPPCVGLALRGARPEAPASHRRTCCDLRPLLRSPLPRVQTAALLHAEMFTVQLKELPPHRTSAQKEPQEFAE